MGVLIFDAGGKRPFDFMKNIESRRLLMDSIELVKSRGQRRAYLYGVPLMIFLRIGERKVGKLLFIPSKETDRCYLFVVIIGVLFFKAILLSSDNRQETDIVSRWIDRAVLDYIAIAQPDSPTAAADPGFIIVHIVSS